MTSINLLFLFSSFFLGFIHTLMGPDHYVPFIAMAKARNWSIMHSAIVTFFAGFSHVMSAFFLGIFGIFIGLTVTKLNLLVSYGVSIAAWFLILFGLLYFVWGVRSAAKYHQKKHDHKHQVMPHRKNWWQLTPWILFVIFILGPCEPLIPLIFYPAIKGEVMIVVWVTIAFSLATILAMLMMVIGASAGLQKFRFKLLERYGNAVAGMVIFVTGCAIKAFGL